MAYSVLFLPRDGRARPTRPAFPAARAENRYTECFRSGGREACRRWDRQESEPVIRTRSDAPARAVRAVALRTVAELRADEITDRADALTYYSVLSISPVLIALVSIVGL